MSRIYVSGPVTGKPDGNRVEFSLAGRRLRYAGHEADIPTDFVRSEASHEEAMLVCLQRLTGLGWPRQDGKVPPHFDGLALLDGWEESAGSRLEKAVAEACGIECRPLADWLGEVDA